MLPDYPPLLDEDEAPLTTCRQGRWGAVLAVNTVTGRMRRMSLVFGNMEHFESTEMYLANLLKGYKALEMIPMRTWSFEDKFGPVVTGVVMDDEDIIEDVKEGLKQYGWPLNFRRDEWYEDTPGLVEGWSV